MKLSKQTMDHIKENLGADYIADILKDKKKLQSYISDLQFDHDLCKDDDPEWYVKDIKELKTILKGIK